MDKTFTMWQVKKNGGGIFPVQVLSETPLMVTIPDTRWIKHGVQYQRKETQYAKLLPTWGEAHAYAIELIQERKARLLADLATVDSILCQLEIAQPERALVVLR